MSRKAFTLVELLVVMMILAILASIVLFALVSVQEDARRMKTKATIQKLNTIVMAKWESYRTRRVPMTPAAGATRIQIEQSRLLALWELMRIEMPCLYNDITDAPVTLTNAPAIQARYKNAILPSKDNQFQNAECLFLFVRYGSGDPEVMEQFSPSEIGDTDGDGMLEFHDGWDRPINFIRWAPGYNTPVQSWNCGSGVTGKTYPTTTHDPFDILHIYKPSTGDLLFNPALKPEEQVNPPLTPIIYSPGPDKKSAIQDGGSSSGIQYSKTSPPNYPYAQVSGMLMGESLDVAPTAEAVDNITSHDGD